MKAVSRITTCLTLLLLHGAHGADAPASLTAKSERKDLPIEIELSGLFKADDKTEISVEPKEYRGSLIIKFIAPEGKTVKQGDPLLKFDRKEVEKEISTAEGEAPDAQIKIEKAKAAFESLRIDTEAELDRARTELSHARKRLEGAEKETAFKLEEKVKAVRGAENGLTDGRQNLEQLKLMYQSRELHTDTETILLAREERSIKEREEALETAKRQLEYAKVYTFPLDLEKARLEAAQKEAALKKLEVQRRADLSEKEAELKKAEQALARIQGRIQTLKDDLENLNVRAPRDGILFYGSIGQENPVGMVFGNQLKQSLRVGGRVQTHQILLTVASMRSLSVEMQVLENDIQHILPDLPVTIRPDAFPELKISGKITEVGQVATQQQLFGEVRKFTVKGTYEGEFAQLRAGMNCRVTVHADAVKDALQIPVASVFEEGGDHFCYLSEGGKPSRRKVKIGATNGKAVQILEGLDAGAEVFLHDPLRE